MNSNYEEQFANICNSIADFFLEADDETINEEVSDAEAENTRALMLNAVKEHRRKQNGQFNGHRQKRL